MPIENREEREIVINKGSASLGITGTVNLYMFLLKLSEILIKNGFRNN